MQPNMLDRDIRNALKEFLRKQDSTGAIIDELPVLRGRGRADLAFVNGELRGYEIKSEADSLVRLCTQVDHYESVFQFNTVVVAKRHLTAARERIPATWGIIEARRTGERTELHQRRKAKRNRKISSCALTRLLWKNECLSILRKAGIETRPRMPIGQLWLLLEAMNPEKLCDELREALKRRQAKAALRCTQGGGSRTTVSIA